MQRASQQRPGAVRAASQTPPVAPGVTTIVLQPNEPARSADLSNAETVVDDLRRGEPQRVLEGAIRQRIVSRLQGRVRNLVVRAYGDLVVLEGECMTYYTKQLAQHAAMGVLDDEHLENAIVVNVPK